MCCIMLAFGHICGYCQGRRRGRKAAWIAFHPESGRCSKCSICANPGTHGGFTHPGLWTKTSYAHCAEYNLLPTSCVCQHCFATKIKKTVPPSSVVRDITNSPVSSDGSERDRHLEPQAKRKFTGPSKFEVRAICNAHRDIPTGLSLSSTRAVPILVPTGSSLCSTKGCANFGTYKLIHVPCSFV